MTAEVSSLQRLAIGRLFVETPAGEGRALLACLVSPHHVVTDGRLFRAWADRGEALRITLRMPDPDGVPQNSRATLERYDSASDLALIRFPDDQSANAAVRQKIVAERLPERGARCEMRVPSRPLKSGEPFDDELVSVALILERTLTNAEGRERFRLRAQSAVPAPQDIAGAPVFWNNSVVGVISDIGPEPADLSAIPATAIRRLMDGVVTQEGVSPNANVSNAPARPRPSQQPNMPPPATKRAAVQQQIVTPSSPPLPDDFFDRLSESSHRALEHADAMRGPLGQHKGQMEHLLLALYEKDKGPTQRELTRAGITERELRSRLSEIAEAELPAFGSYQVRTLDALPQVSDHVREALVAAHQVADASSSRQIQSRHLLYGALSVRECRAVRWMFDRTTTVDPAQIDMSAPPSKAGVREPVQQTAAPDDSTVTGVIDRGQRRARVAPDLPDGDDLLDIRREVRAICAVIAARDTSPPLSIGLFGDWGTGKSFFMNRMEERIEKLKKTARDNPASAYCRNIVQLRFNAWHYMDTDLWASLAAEIFEGLARALEKDDGLLAGVSGDPTVARARLLAATSHLRDVRAQAEQRKADADLALTESQKRLSSLAQEERDIISRLSPRQLIKAAYRFVAGQEKTAQSIDDAAKRLGIPQGKALASDTRATLLELKGLWGGVKAVWLALRSGSARLLLILIFALLAVLGAIWLVQHYSHLLAPKIGAVIAFGLSALGIIKGVIGPTRAALATIAAARAESQTLIDEERTRREAELRKAHGAIQQRANAEEEAITRVTQEIAQLERQLEALRADRQMAEFVRAKQESTDYTRHFGVIARARSDFQQLTDLLRRVVEEAKEGDAKKAADEKRPPIPRIDRIILYIDDLDRCPEAKVVDVLQAVHLLLAFPLFIVVVGVDSRWLLHSLRQHASVFKSNEDNEDDGMDLEERVHWQSTPFNYLEKIFQIPFNLRPMAKTGFMALIDDLTIPKKRVDGAAASGQVAKPIDVPAQIGETVVAVADRARDTTVVAAAAEETRAPAQTATAATPAPPQAIGAEPAQAASSQIQSPPAAGAATTHEPAGRDEHEPEGDPIDANPPFLDLTDMERKFMHRMHRLIPTPRAAKRYVNVYRLLRASLPDKERTLLEDEAEAGCRSVLLMLAILTGFPQEGTVILRELVEREPAGSWWTFLEQLSKENAEIKTTDTATLTSVAPWPNRSDKKEDRRKIEERQRAQRWEELMARMRRVRADVGSELPNDPTCDEFSRWARHVARYSFEAGRVVGAENDAVQEGEGPSVLAQHAS